MSSKISAFAIVSVLYVVFSAVYFEIVIQTVQAKSPYLEELNHIHHKIVKQHNITNVQVLLERCDEIYSKVEKDANSLYYAFEIISILSVANLSFFV